jgi:hypothetical protein
MDKFMMMPKGFMGIPMDEEFITTAENKKNTQIVIDDWMLGPENPNNEPTANKVYWVALGKAMQVDEKEGSSSSLLQLRVLRQQHHDAGQNGAYPAQ